MNISLNWRWIFVQADYHKDMRNILDENSERRWEMGFIARHVFFEKAMLISDLNIISLRDKKTEPLVSCITPDCLGYEFRLSLVEGASIG